MDDSGDGWACHPASVLVFQPNATNKPSILSTLMCSGSSCREPLLFHILFSSNAERDENYEVNAVVL